MIAWILSIVSGLVFCIYLAMSALLLFGLTLGESRFNHLMARLAGPPFVFIEMTFFLCIAFHIANGVRTLLMDLCLWVDDQRDMWYVFIVIAIIIFAFHFFL